MSTVMTQQEQQSPSFRPGMMVRGLAWDIGLPVAAYYGLHLLGVGDWPALLAATAVSGVRLVWGMSRERRLNPFATVMLVVFGVGVVLAFVTGDARFVLLKNSIITGAVGLVFLATTVVGRPLTLSAAQSFRTGSRAEMEELYRTSDGFRRVHRVSSAVWGGGLLLEALVRVPLIYALPVSVMVGLSEVITIVTFAVLIAWNIWYGRRAARRLRRT